MQRHLESRLPKPTPIYDTFLGVQANQVFGKRIMVQLHATPIQGGLFCNVLGGNHVNDYFIYFLASVRGTAQHTSSCINYGL